MAEITRLEGVRMFLFKKMIQLSRLISAVRGEMEPMSEQEEEGSGLTDTPLLFESPSSTPRTPETSVRSTSHSMTSTISSMASFPLIKNHSPLMPVSSPRMKSHSGQSSPLVPRDIPLLDVLIVEDNKTNQKVIQLMIDRIGGVRYEFANHGEEGVQKYLKRKKEESTDIQMPILDGLAATEKIRLTEKEMGWERVHITALTANAFEEEKEKCTKAGMDDYLSKPIGLDTLSNKLKSLRKGAT
ncbi:multi-sensor hybrid histidine kinase [Planoprotostelium fungivorum]|uniref:Multi-sensor hybrid histidine kinase n=1 Tax=Planoprotostelium fungivorum TaxID=1890364 RepID=A0A2P6MT43_9EUKA|nr:multi-sensor hybrid histidine kinase [Planoprotostelium fungivorum]PRP74872.1 multi-sensor hybrid histidine kinase [Planoprotostelium fungivorum]